MFLGGKLWLRKSPARVPFTCSLPAIGNLGACTAFLQELVGRLKWQPVLSVSKDRLSVTWRLSPRKKKGKNSLISTGFELLNCLRVPYCALLFNTPTLCHDMSTHTHTHACTRKHMHEHTHIDTHTFLTSCCPVILARASFA